MVRAVNGVSLSALHGSDAQVKGHLILTARLASYATPRYLAPLTMAPMRSTATAPEAQGFSEAFLRALDNAPMGEPDSDEVARLVAEGRAASEDDCVEGDDIFACIPRD